MSQECLICQMYEKRSRLIFENGAFVARFDGNPISPGHTIIFPKEHISFIWDFNDIQWLELKAAIKDTISLIERTSFSELYSTLPSDASENHWKEMLHHIGVNKKPEAYNIGSNEGKAAGRKVEHFHLHIIPRYFGDIEHPEGGIRNIIPDLASWELRDLQ